MFYWIKNSENLIVNFIWSTLNTMRNINSIIWFGCKKIKMIFHVFDNFFDYNKNLINKNINRLNMIDSPKTYKYFVFFRFSNKHVLMKLYQFKVFSNFNDKGDQNYYIWSFIWKHYLHIYIRIWKHYLHLFSRYMLNYRNREYLHLFTRYIFWITGIGNYLHMETLFTFIYTDMETLFTIIYKIFIELQK